MKDAFLEQGVPLDIYSVTSREVKNHFVAYLIDRVKSDNTVNGRIKGVKQFFRYLFEEGWMTNNIADELHVVKAEKLMIQTFTREQVADLLEQPDRKTFTGFQRAGDSDFEGKRRKSPPRAVPANVRKNSPQLPGHPRRP
jgi:Site-specific recombinase XerD